MDSPARHPGRPKDAELGARRVEEILEAAATIFAQRGYPKTDVQMVADLIGVGKGTIYRYFPSKRELFLAAVDRGMQRIGEQIDAAVADLKDPLEKVIQGVRAYLSVFDANPEYVELLVQERAVFKDRSKPTYFEHAERDIGPWRELLLGLMANGRIRTMPVERITDVMGDLLYGTMFTNFFAGRRKSFEEQAHDILDIVFHGILSEKERAIRNEE